MKKFYTTSTGHQIEIASVPPQLIEEVRLKAMEKIEVPPVPTYQVELMDGSFLTYEHNESSISDPATSESDKQLWQKYIVAKDEQIRYAATKVMDLFMIKGTVINKEEIEEGEWLQIQRYFELDIPTEPFELKSHYLRTELLRTVEDINGLMSSIVEMTGIDKTILQAAKNSFRSDIREEENTITGVNGTEPVTFEREMED